MMNEAVGGGRKELDAGRGKRVKESERTDEEGRGRKRDCVCLSELGLFFSCLDAWAPFGFVY